MSKELLLKRGSTEAHENYIGKIGEITLDTDKQTIQIHDGKTAGGASVPNYESAVVLYNAVRELKYVQTIKQLQEYEQEVISIIEYLESKRDEENGYYKYVQDSVTWYSWPELTGRKVCTMEGLIALDAEFAAENGVSDWTYHQETVAEKCRLINYPDDLKPMTEEEAAVWSVLNNIRQAITDVQSRFGVPVDENTGGEE